MLNRRSCFTTLIPCNLFEGPHTFQKTTVWWSTSGRFPFQDFWPEIKWNGKSFENLRIRFKCTLFDGISTIIETFAKGVGFNLPTEHEVTRTSEKKNNTGRRSISSRSMPVTTNSGRWSEAFYFTSKKSIICIGEFLLNGKRPHLSSRGNKVDRVMYDVWACVKMLRPFTKFYSRAMKAYKEWRHLTQK